MPFTLAHPVAAIPLLRPLGRFGVLSALVLGSCMPDMPYFLALPVERDASHSLAGLLWFCLPLGLLCYLLFHKLLKGPLLALLPGRVLRRLAPQVAVCTVLPQARWLAVAVSLLCGAATHDAWDAFTHGDGWGVVRLAFLQRPWLGLPGYTAYGYSFAQHGSSLLGMAALAWGCARWLRRQPVLTPVRPPVHLSLAAKLGVVVALLALPLSGGLWAGLDAYAFAIEVNLPPWRLFMGTLVFTTLPLGTLAVLLYSLGWQALRLWAGRPPSR